MRKHVRLLDHKGVTQMEDFEAIFTRLWAALLGGLQSWL